jgi:hypothetical protein
MTISFAFLAPSLVKAAVEGRLPRGIGLARLIDAPAEWDAAGVSKEDAHVYAEGIRRGGTLVTARVPDVDRAKCEAILNRASVNIQDFLCRMFMSRRGPRAGPKRRPRTRHLQNTARGNRPVQKERTCPAGRAQHLNDKKETGPLAGGMRVTFFAEPGSKRFV